MRTNGWQGCLTGSQCPEAEPGITDGSLLPAPAMPLQCRPAADGMADPGGTGGLSFGPSSGAPLCGGDLDLLCRWLLGITHVPPHFVTEYLTISILSCTLFPSFRPDQTGPAPPHWAAKNTTSGLEICQVRL